MKKVSKLTAARRAALASAAIAVLVAACGSDDDTDAGGGASTTAVDAATTADPASGGSSATAASNSTPAPSGEPIELPLIIDLTNNQGAYEGFKNAYLATVDAVNASGGINGRPLELKVCDSARDPNQTAQCARDAVDAGAPAVVSLALTGTYLPILEQAGIADIGNTLADPVQFTNPMSFPLWAGGAGGVAGAGVMLGHKDCTKAAAVSAAPAANNEVVLAGLQAGAAVVDVPVELVAATPGAPDMAPAIATAVDGGADCLVLAGSATDIVAMIRAADQSGADVQLFTFSGLLPAETLQSLGSAADDLNLVAATHKASSADRFPAVKEWVDTIERYSDDPKNTTEDASANAYASILLFARVAASVETVDAPSVLAALNALHDYDPGVTPVISFDTPGTSPFGPRVFAPAVIFTHVEGGEPVEDTGEFIDITTNRPVS